MVRMLGFSDEDKQRIGVAQQGSGKGVVRGVLGLPGRLVGGILGGGSSDAAAAANMASEDQVLEIKIKRSRRVHFIFVHFFFSLTAMSVSIVESSLYY